MLEPESPQGQRDFEKKEGCDAERDIGERFEPGWVMGMATTIRVGNQIPQVNENACSVDDNLWYNGSEYTYEVSDRRGSTKVKMILCTVSDSKASPVRCCHLLYVDTDSCDALEDCNSGRVSLWKLIAAML